MYSHVVLVASFPNDPNPLTYEEETSTWMVQTHLAHTGKKGSDHTHCPPTATLECHAFL